MRRMRFSVMPLTCKGRCEPGSHRIAVSGLRLHYQRQLDRSARSAFLANRGVAIRFSGQASPTHPVTTYGILKTIAEVARPMPIAQVVRFKQTVTTVWCA